MEMRGLNSGNFSTQGMWRRLNLARPLGDRVKAETSRNCLAAMYCEIFGLQDDALSNTKWWLCS